MITDEQIRQAMLGLADLANTPDRLRTSVRGAVRTHRQRRALLVSGAAVAAAVAVGVPATLALRERHTGDPPKPATGDLPMSATGDLPTPAPEPIGAGNPRVPFLFRPTWLPPGLVEMVRQAHVGNPEQFRTWTTPAAIQAERTGQSERANQERRVILSIYRTVREWQPADTTVAGQPAWLDTSPGAARVEWFLDDHHVVSINLSTGVAEPGEEVLRIANALVPDTVGAAETSLRFGWLPPAAGHIRAITTVGYPDGWVQSLHALLSTHDDRSRVEAWLVTSRDLLPHGIEGDHVTVLGRPGRAFAPAHVGYGDVTVELDSGRWLQVRCHFDGNEAHPRDTTLRVADGLHVGPDPYLGWIGRR